MYHHNVVMYHYIVRELLLLVGIWDNVSVIHTIVGNADLTVLHSAVAIISANPSSKSAVKSQILCEQTARILRQTTKYALYCKATNNVDTSIKFQKFLQRFAVFFAKCLQTQRFLQYSCPWDLE